MKSDSKIYRFFFGRRGDTHLPFGAIVIYGDFYNGEPTEDGVAILPLDDSFDKEKAKEYAQNHNIEYGE